MNTINIVKTKTGKPKKGKGKRAKPQQQTVVIHAPTPQKKKTRQKAKSGAGMTECGRKYALSLSQPFSAQADGCCLPFPPDAPSLKANCLVRANLQVDLGGTAWVVISPTLAKDKTALWTSTVNASAFPITIATKDTAPANYAAFTASGLPFAQSDIVSGSIAGRIVSVAIRITYVGTAANMSGLYFAYTNADRDNVNSSTYSIANILTSKECKLARVTNKPFEMAYTVASPEHYRYVGHKEATAGVGTAATYGQVACYPWSSGVDINGKGPCLTGAIDNGAAMAIIGITNAIAPSSFYVEYIQHVEYVGRSATFGLTPSHSDPPAASAVETAAQLAATDYESSSGTWGSVFSKALNHVRAEMNPNAAMQAAGHAYKAYRGYKALSGRQYGALSLIGG
jgi:hypothetical protein